MPKISLMIHTASPDNFLRMHGIPSYFAALCENLTWQTWQDFELIYVDFYHDENRDRFRGVAGGFMRRVKHVPVHPGHRYWLDRGNCFISAAKNTGVLYADGELLVSCDDAEFFPAEFLAMYWWHYAAGHYLHALHKRMRTIEITDGRPSMPLAGDFYVNDHRWNQVAHGRHQEHRFGEWLFAGTSVSIADAVNLNGFNERMDGCKSLEDCDFGNRLAMLGRSFALDPAAYACILDHNRYAGDIETTIADGQQAKHERELGRPINEFVAVENYGLFRAAREHQAVVANRDPLTEADWKIIQEDTIKYRKFDPLAPENAERLAIWKGTPTFNLAEEREALRRSPDWKW